MSYVGNLLPLYARILSRISSQITARANITGCLFSGTENFWGGALRGSGVQGGLSLGLGGWEGRLKYESLSWMGLEKDGLSQIVVVGRGFEGGL